MEGSINMVRFFNNLRIGEKIGLSFGLVGLLFLGVIWQYQMTLKQSLSDYQRLLDVFEAKKSLALNIERFMLEARRAENDFLIHRKEAAFGRVRQYVGRVREEAAKLKKIDAEALVAGEQISQYMKIYHTRFEAVAAAWREKGLDHNSGLQGRFRDRAHDLEDLLKTQNVPDLENNILQLRRREKDYLLRHDTQYVDMVKELVQIFRFQLAQSGIAAENKQKLYALLDDYHSDFIALVAQNDIINRLAVEMNDAADKITRMVEQNVKTADQTMRETTQAITADSQANSNWMLLIVFVALLLGVSFATYITRYITRSLHRIGTVLSRMAHSDPTDRVPVTGGRDELDAMGSAVNTMSDHMERLIAWSMATIREDESHLRSIVYSIPPGLFIADRDGIVETLNPELASMFGYSPSELIEQPFSKLFTTKKGPDECQSLLDLMESQSMPGLGVKKEMTGWSQDGRKIHCSLMIGTVGQGKERRYAGLVLDITLCRETEANWHQAMDERQELLTLMSHEIYTLMDSIVGMVDDLAETDRAGKRRSYAEIMKQSGQWVLDIVDVILGHSKVHTQWLELNEADFDLHLLIDNLSVFFSNFARIKGIEYRVQRHKDLPDTVYGDSGNLNRILMNLLSNAVKFTKSGEIGLSIDLASEDPYGYRIRFRIQDTGVGIDSFKIKHLFEQISPTDDSDTFEYKRPIQGFVITNHLVGLLDGTITVSSKPGEGSTFTVNIPMKKATIARVHE